MDNGSQSSSLSPQFQARLDRLAPDQRVRAVVLLHTRGAGSGRRQSPSARQEAIAAVRAAAALALPDIDAILEHHGGQRLASEPGALGSIAVETTPAGVLALAALPHVQAILEDQPLSLAATPAHS